MRAVMIEAHGEPESLVVREVPDPTASSGQVVIDVKAAGVSFPDLLMVRGLYQFKPALPFPPGGEVAGVVSAVGEGVADLRAGDRVMVVTGFGGFAEKVIAPADRVLKIPDAMPFDVAAGFQMNYATTMHALVDRAQLRKGETLLVLGAAGGVGVTAVEVGKLLGARVVAAASSPDKLEIARAAGADELVDYSQANFKQQLKALGGVDVVYDPVGGPYTDPALRGLRPGGRHLVIGFAAGEIPKIPANLTLMKECAVVGVFWGAFAMREPKRNAAHLERLLGWYAEERLRPLVTQRYPFEDASRALRDVAERRVRGKVVLTV